MNIFNLKRKAIALSLGLAALLLPTAGKAQSYNDATAESYNGGAFYELIAYDTYLDELANALRAVEFNNRSGETFGISNADFGETAPLGSGLAILIGAGLGYVALKKKEDER